MEQFAREVKELVLANNLDYVGIASADRFKYAPEGHKATDILPGAKSVIVGGIKITKGAQLTQRRALANPKLRHISLSYRWAGYGLLNRHFLEPVALKVARFLEEKGYIAVPTVSSGVDNSANMGISAAAFSNKHAAVAAGLGEFGWNSLCLTSDNGPRQRFVSVITNAELEPDPMYNGPKLCQPGKCAELGSGQSICSAVCPIGSFSLDRARTCIVGDREFKYGYNDYFKCATVGSGLLFNTLGLVDIGINTIRESESEFASLVKFAQRQPIYQQVEAWVFGRSHYCARCLLRCPVGAPAILDEIMQIEGEEAVYGAYKKG